MAIRWAGGNGGNGWEKGNARLVGNQAGVETVWTGEPGGYFQIMSATVRLAGMNGSTCSV
jgi:hypothetical protein